MLRGYTERMTAFTVQREETGNKGVAFIERDGVRLAAMTFSRVNPTKVIIDHTEVSDALRGQGAGRALLDALVAWGRESGTRFLPLCPFAKAQFEKDPSLRDVLAT